MSIEKKEWKEEIKERLVAEILKARMRKGRANVNKFFKDYMFSVTLFGMRISD